MVFQKWTTYLVLLSCYAFLYASAVPGRKQQETVDFINPEITKPCGTTKFAPCLTKFVTIARQFLSGDEDWHRKIEP
jgi:hypothetical protein